MRNPNRGRTTPLATITGLAGLVTFCSTVGLVIAVLYGNDSATLICAQVYAFAVTALTAVLLLRVAVGRIVGAARRVRR